MHFVSIIKCILNPDTFQKPQLSRYFKKGFIYPEVGPAAAPVDCPTGETVVDPVVAALG